MTQNNTLIQQALVINEGISMIADVRIVGDRIAEISESGLTPVSGEHVIDATGLWLLPGVIDDQVHFREPGFTHKGEIATESKAALAGGVTTYMEMPNVNPQTITIEHLEKKMDRAAEVSFVNYSFFLGATNHNADELLKINPKNTCGIKIFMGSSTGDMLVDNEKTLNRIFSESKVLIATHCEVESRIKRRLNEVRHWYGDDIPADMHPVIRDDISCYESSSFAIALAKKHNTRLHILHLTTELELNQFRNDIPLREKRITTEVCVHHLHFTGDDYERLGNLIKCNPAIKASHNKEALWKALLDDRLDIIATDHAPHTWQEKQQPYLQSPAGLPLVQHGLQIMLSYVSAGKISPEKVVEKMCHAPADCFQIKERGYIRPGYFADLVLVNPNSSYTVSKENLEYKCAWSPFEGTEFNSSIEKVFVNGTLSWDNGYTGHRNVRRVEFDR